MDIWSAAYQIQDMGMVSAAQQVQDMGIVSAAAQQVQDMGIVSAAQQVQYQHQNMYRIWAKCQQQPTTANTLQYETSVHNITIVLKPKCTTNTRLLFSRFPAEYPAYNTLMGMIFVLRFI